MEDDVKLNDRDEGFNELGALFIKIFTAEEELGAKCLLQNFLDNKEKITKRNKDRETFINSKEWIDYNHALSSQFKFYFPIDNIECENGINTKMVNSDGEDEIMMILKNKNGVGKELASDVFFYLYEYQTSGHIGFFSLDGEVHAWDSPDTVLEVVHRLVQLGFEYDKNADCLFKQEITILLEQHELEQNIENVNKTSSNNKL